MAENALAVQDVDTAIKLLTRHRKNLSAASKIRADARLADLSLQAGYAKQAMAYRKRAYRAYSAGLAKEDAALRAAVARMVFNAVDRSYKRYMHIALSKKIDNSVVQEKAKLLEKLEKGYHEVVQYHSPHWTLAALSRSFDINREFALFIENAPMPDLSGDQKAQYRELLAQKAASYMDKAQKYRSASVSQARKWKACDSSLTAYLIDGDGSNGHPGQALPFSPSAATTEVAERFIEIDSLKTLHEKLMQDPDDLQALSSLAAAYLDTRDFKHAALVAKKLLESVKPEQKTVMATAYNLLGMAHLFDGNDPAAQDAFQRALSEEPGHTGAKINLAGLYKHYGYRRDAEKLYQSVSEASVDMQADPSIHPRAKELFYENNKLAKN